MSRLLRGENQSQHKCEAQIAGERQMLAWVMSAEEASRRGEKAHVINDVLTLFMFAACAELQAYEPTILMSFHMQVKSYSRY